MDWTSIAGSGIGALGNFLGADLNSQAITKANQDTINEENYLASNGIQLKVKDAQAAGINPLAALGVTEPSMGESLMPDTSMGNAVSQTGQDISRAVGATRSQADRDYQDKVNKQNIESRDLDIQIKKAQLANMPGNQPQNPPLPVSAQYAPGQFSGVTRGEVAGYPKGLPHDAGSIYNYYNVPGASSEDWYSNLGISPSDISRGFANWYRMSQLSRD